MLFFQIVTLVLATASTLEAAPHDISTSPTGTDPNVGSHTEDLAENSGGNLERRGFPLLAGIGVVRAVGFIVATVGTALFVNQALTPKEPEKQRFTAPPQVITPTPTSTTTSSIQTQSCNVCIACADIQTPETSAPRPEGGEWFPGYDRSHGHLPKGDKARRIEKITRASRRRRPKRFAKERTARTTICGFYVWSPKYTPWSEHTTKAWNYYDYDMSKVCPKFQFKLDPVQDQTHTYATEHVYEIQLIRMYLKWRVNQQDFMTYQGNASECDILGPILTSSQQWEFLLPKILLEEKFPVLPHPMNGESLCRDSL